MRSILITVFFLSIAIFLPTKVDAEQSRRRILAATVMISMTTPNWQKNAEKVDEALPIPNDEYRTFSQAEGDIVADGLGTLVALGEETLLVTHDHWKHFDGTLGTVTISNANGSPVAVMALQVFKQYLRFRDGGTMVFAVPDAVASTINSQAKTARVNDFQRGDRVLMARRSNGRVVLTKASVVVHEVKNGRSVIRIRTLDGEAVVGGDSGGGVWVNGRLAANLWTTVMMENEITGEQKATDLSLAAVYAPELGDLCELKERKVTYDEGSSTAYSSCG